MICCPVTSFKILSVHKVNFIKLYKAKFIPKLKFYRTSTIIRYPVIISV